LGRCTNELDIHLVFELVNWDLNNIFQDIAIFTL
jgi:hypothetical protein